MSEIYDKFIYWIGLIDNEKPQLSFVFSKIFNSLNLSLELLSKEKEYNKLCQKLEPIVAVFNDNLDFEDKIKLFNSIYLQLIETHFFELTPQNFETLERIRKTQYHIWNLFDFAYNYNKYVRLYNDRLEYPERKKIAQKSGFIKKSHIMDNSWIEKSPIFIIGVAGPSCSGKSTVSRILKYNYPFKITTINADVFFKKYTPSKYNGYDNWETEDAVMLDKLATCIEQLKDGEPTVIPSHGWTEAFDNLIYPTRIIIVEGFLLFLNEDINKLLDLKIYFELNEENQLKRRVKRQGVDNKEYIENVVIPHYRKYRSKIRQNSDYIIDGNVSKIEVVSKVKEIIKNTKLINVKVL